MNDPAPVWVFSHCLVDHFEGDDGCEGCPALADANGKPRADRCEAVFVRVLAIARPAIHSMDVHGPMTPEQEARGRWLFDRWVKW